MIFSVSAERSSERPRDLLADKGIVTIFNPLCVISTDSVRPNNSSFSLFVFLVPALDSKSYALRLRPLPTGEAFMSLNPCCTSNEIVNRGWNSVSLTRWSSQYFFGREMVGPQFRFREHIPIVS